MKLALLHVSAADSGETQVDDLPLVPHHQVEQVFADRLLAGVLRRTELRPSMSQRAGQEEPLITDQSETDMQDGDMTSG